MNVIYERSLNSPLELCELRYKMYKMGAFLQINWKILLFPFLPKFSREKSVLSTRLKS